jgi:hypothetical protein
MKLLIAILICFTVFSCSKVDTPTPNTPSSISSYVGTYNSTSGDTAYVTEGVLDIINIRWAARSGNSITFDSVKISDDFTFTDNELVEFGAVRHSLGTGYFLSNTVYFKFVLDNNAQIIFNGIKH